MPERRTNASILIVEDEALIAAALEAGLAELDYHVCGQAASSETALKLVEKHQPDLVLMDIIIDGEMDGIEVAELIREKWDTPVVFLTAYADTHHLERAKPAHPFGYILKPFQDRDLRIGLEMALHFAKLDIERRKAEAALKEREELFEQLAENINEVFYIREENEFLYINPNFESVWGMPREAIYRNSKAFLDSVHPHDKARVARATEIERTEKSGAFNEEFRIIRPDGEIRWIWTRSFPVSTAGPRTRAAGISEDITERKRAEEALKESEERFRSITEQITDTIFLIDRQGVITYISPIAEEIFGFSIEEMLNRSVMSFIDEESRKSAYSAFLATTEKGIPTINLRLKLKHKDGSTILGELSGKEYFEQGESVGAIGVIRDITEQVKAEDELKESEERFKSAIEGAQDGMWDWNFATGEFYYSERLAFLLGFDVSELPKTIGAWRDLLHPDDRGVTRAIFEECVRQKSDRYETTQRIRTKSGTYKWFTARATVLYDDEGNPIRFLGANTDVTEQIKAEEALRESEERFRLTFHTIPDSIILTRLEDGRFVDVNAAFTNVFGYTREEAVGKTAFDLGIWQNPDDRKEMVNSLRETGVCMNLETRFRKKDGVIRNGLVDARLVPFQGVPHIIGITRDVTDAKRAEEEKEQLQAQLQQSQKMEAIGTLTSGISHDFNNLLQAVIGYAETMLLKKIENDHDYSSLKGILEAGEKAAYLVKQLLLFSRKAETERKPFDLNQGIYQAKIILERTIPKMIDIQIRPGSRIWNISADSIQMEQILLNLGTNAADAMPDGGALTIETQNVTLDDDYARSHLEAQPGRYVILTVSDTGHGMDKSTVDKIFEPFFTTKGIGKGTGLGLASVYGIVKGHDGYIICYSEIDMGTTFRIYLPAIEEPLASLESEAAAESLQGGTETILVVDDEELIREYIIEILANFGYKVITASSGEEALEIYAENQKEIDAIMLDIGMPGMGGHNCLRELVKINNSVKVIVASGYSADGQVKKTMEAGAAAYVGKPYRLKDILHKIRSVLDAQA